MLRSPLLGTIAVVVVATAAQAADNRDEAPSVAELDKASQQLKGDMLDLQGELRALERDINHPAKDRWTVFVTRQSGNDKGFRLEQISLALNDRQIAKQQYTADERRALRRGGADRLHLGTLRRGRHHATVTIRGQYNNKSFRREQTLTVDKPDGPRLMAIRVRPRVATESGGTDKPGVSVRHLDDLP